MSGTVPLELEVLLQKPGVRFIHDKAAFVQRKHDVHCTYGSFRLLASLMQNYGY